MIIVEVSVNITISLFVGAVSGFGILSSWERKWF
jgi:hypothetical protein